MESGKSPATILQAPHKCCSLPKVIRAPVRGRAPPAEEKQLENDVTEMDEPNVLLFRVETGRSERLQPLLLVLDRAVVVHDEEIIGVVALGRRRIVGIESRPASRTRRADLALDCGPIQCRRISLRPPTLAVPTGFEPAISSLTGTYARPLHHGTVPEKARLCALPSHHYE